MLLFSCVSFTASALLPPLIDWILRLQASTTRPEHYKYARTEPETILLAFWSSALGVSATLVFLTSITSNFSIAAALIALNGVSWATANWIPFALIGRLTAEGSFHQSLKPQTAGLYSDSGGERSGSITGLHNIAISAPQILAASICALILLAARHADSQNSAGWVLRAGGVAFVAASCVALRSGTGKTSTRSMHQFDFVLQNEEDAALF